MKKLLRKVRRKKPEVEESARITTETIAEHREQILAGGRRFKYPVQYARHKLVFNAIIISIGVIILAVVLGWWQLYVVQNTSDFMYRVTKLIPLSVASVDGQRVLYSDYLMKYRSSAHYLEEKEQINFKTEDGKSQSDFIKQQAMQDAVVDAYARKIAKEKDITVTDVELETFLKLQRVSPDGEVSEKTYEAVILDYYGWSPDEYRRAMKSKLLRQKVAYAVDSTASATVAQVKSALDGGSSDLAAIATNVSAAGEGQVRYASQGWIPKNNQDGGLTTAATGLQKGQISGIVTSTSGDGYYFVKLNDINDTQVNYDYIHIPLTVFSATIAGLEDPKSTLVKHYITVPEVVTQE